MDNVCPKCGRVKTQQDPSLEECPRCGIVYSRYYITKNSRDTQKNGTFSLIGNYPEKHLQDEIQKRVIEYERQLQESREREQQTQATLEALTEITEVPLDTSRQIAEQVQREYELSQVQLQARQQMRRRLLRGGVFLVIGIILVLSFMVIRINLTKGEPPQVLRVIFTHKLTEGGMGRSRTPVDSLESVDMNAKGYYFYIKWSALTPNTEYMFRCRFFDGNNNLVKDKKFKFRTTSSTRNTWCNYNFFSGDKPGQWRHEAFLNNQKLLEEQLMVISTQ